MNFTKIKHHGKPWLDIVTDIDKVSATPLFVLAERFKVYKLIIRNPVELRKKVMFLLEGDKEKNEKAIIIFDINQTYNMVEKITLQRSLKWDGEICLLLKKAMLIELINSKSYIFSSAILNEL